MNRSELIDALAKQTDSKKTDCERWLDAFVSTVEQNIKCQDGVRLVGFGTFTVSHRKARSGRNPQTGETLEIPAKTAPYFKPGTQLKEWAQKNGR